MKKNSGFTLIELLVVIAIIALLASIVLIALSSARAKSRDAKRIGDIRQLVTALELYYNTNNGYPSTLAGLAPTYIGAAPSAPATLYGSCTSVQNTHTYTSASPNTTYSLTFCLGATSGAYAAGPHTASPNGII